MTDQVPSKLEMLMDRWIDTDPEAASRWIESQLARIELRKRLAEAREREELRKLRYEWMKDRSHEQS